MRLKATIGPFGSSPFGTETYLSPINSVPKKNCTDRQFIMDLSMSHGNSINHGIDKDKYLDDECKLTLPSVDHLANRVMELTKKGTVKLFKVDLSRAYHQIFSCPKNINWLGYVYKGKFYFDCTLSMGHGQVQGALNGYLQQWCLYIVKWAILQLITLMI